MATTDGPPADAPTVADTPDVRPIAAVLGVAGLGLVGAGSYFHLTIDDRTLGDCVATGVCTAWHPTWVLAPLAAGSMLLFAAVGLLVRR
jgi:hypothetical protein